MDYRVTKKNKIGNKEKQEQKKKGKNATDKAKINTRVRNSSYFHYYCYPQFCYNPTVYQWYRTIVAKSSAHY